MINTELHNIAELLKFNKLSLNINKTKHMIFQMPKKLTVPPLISDGVNIERVQHFNFLGLTLDTHFNWHKRIEKVANKCCRTIGIINKLKRVLQKVIMSCDPKITQESNYNNICNQIQLTYGTII